MSNLYQYSNPEPYKDPYDHKEVTGPQPTQLETLLKVTASTQWFLWVLYTDPRTWR